MNILLVKIYCHQQHIIEQAKFTYSPMGKAFEKQTKTIEDQGEKQIKAIQDNKKQLANINEDYKNKLLFSKERETFRKIYNERLDKIEELNKKVYYDYQKFLVKSIGEELAFHKSEDPMIFLNEIKTGKISLEEAKNLQQDYEALANINIFINAKNNAIKFIEDYGSIILEAKGLAKQGTGCEILTHKQMPQMLQRLPIALSQVTAGNNSGSLLN